jgi:hypothetical protein
MVVSIAALFHDRGLALFPLVPKLLWARPIFWVPRPLAKHPSLSFLGVTRTASWNHERRALRKLQDSSRDCLQRMETRLECIVKTENGERDTSNIGSFPKQTISSKAQQRENIHCHFSKYVVAHDKKETSRYLHSNLGLFQMAIHRGINPNDRPLNYRPILELNGHLLSIQFL